MLLQADSGFFGTSNSSMPSWARVSTPPHRITKLLSRANKSEAIRSVQTVNKEIQQKRLMFTPYVSRKRGPAAFDADKQSIVRRLVLQMFI
jgi:hypothetical protein